MGCRCRATRGAKPAWGQLDPVVLVTADGYAFGGGVHHKRPEIAGLRAGLTSLKATVVVPRIGVGAAMPDRALDWDASAAEGTASAEGLAFAASAVTWH
ncbi:hypothetical protein BMW24_023420 [Mycobacterium heckeshornense]|nr:hypothetical protein ACT16_23450 [Mycobacterium heckeshornense]PIJ28591.1 hypothetical protein BMW24_023420 [Mycobacterium heckeshornense]